MNCFYFYDSTLSLKEATQYFYNHFRKNGGHIDNKLVPVFIELAPNSNTSGSANAQLGLIELKRVGSIVTLFHELRHIINRSYDQESNSYYNSWIFEDNYPETTTEINGIVKINRGVKGLFIAEGVAELYARKAYQDLGNDFKITQTLISRPFYEEEALVIDNLCSILNIEKNQFITLPCQIMRTFLKERVQYYSDGEYNWESLEEILDFIAMKKYIELNFPTFYFENTSLEKFQFYRNLTKIILESILLKSYTKEIINYEEYISKKKNLKLLEF